MFQGDTLNTRRASVLQPDFSFEEEKATSKVLQYIGSAGFTIFLRLIGFSQVDCQTLSDYGSAVSSTGLQYSL